MAKKKIKKFLKKIAPIAALALGATALGRRNRMRATDAPGDELARAKKLLTSNRAYTGGGYDDPIMTGGVGVKSDRRFDPYAGLAQGQQIFSFKKGGRVGCGKAKRGFGKAMPKGRKK